MREDLTRDLARRLIGVSGLAELDEIGIFSEAAGIDVERNAMLSADFLHRTNVVHRNRLAAAGIVGDGQHYQWDFLRSVTRDDFREAGSIHIPLEGMQV